MNARLLQILFVVISSSAISAAWTGDLRWDARTPDVRSQFAQALQRISGDVFEAGSKMPDVRAVLGDPDDVITETDDRIGPGYVKWCYGTAGHLTLPTLGTVTFDDSGKVRVICGAGAPPAAELPGEPELRELLRLVDRVRVDYFEPSEFNPRDMVAVVNTLRELGKRKALAVLHEYSRIQSTFGLEEGLGAIIIMRFLFSAPVGEVHPTTYFPFEEYKSAAFPAFPAVVLEDVPLYLFPLGGWGLGGGVPGVDEYLEWYAEHGAIIDKPLRPVDDPRLAWTLWQKGLRNTIHTASAGHAAAADDLIRTQLLRMVDTVHQRQFDDDTLFFANKQDLWAAAIITLQETPCRWDEGAALYVRANDGTFVKPKPEPLYARVIWELPLEGRRARLVLHRISETTVDISVEQTAKNAAPLPCMHVRIFVTTHPERAITTLEVDGDFTSGSKSTSSRFDLDKAIELRAQLVRDATVIAESPVLNVDREIGRGK